ncbi:MAG TPA: hypothetical protein VD767_00135 [Thermomicrobiales bacterium]|nr:hypothetical protein [Thermomicrobiales bacterium]
MQEHQRSTIEQALLTGAVTGGAAIIVLKLGTGIAFIPLLIVFLLVFAIAAILRLRMLRMGGRRHP